jgi:hypothetical protein
LAGFDNSIVDIIYHCISSSSMCLNWNGNRMDSFVPSRGVRQRDPISPYLFVLAIERLAHCISEKVEANLWKPLVMGRNDPPISHLLFTDDIILVAEANLEEVRW